MDDVAIMELSSDIEDILHKLIDDVANNSEDLITEELITDEDVFDKKEIIKIMKNEVGEVVEQKLNLQSHSEDQQLGQYIRTDESIISKDILTPTTETSTPGNGDELTTTKTGRSSSIFHADDIDADTESSNSQEDSTTDVAEKMVGEAAHLESNHVEKVETDHNGNHADIDGAENGRRERWFHHFCFQFDFTGCNNGGSTNQKILALFKCYLLRLGNYGMGAWKTGTVSGDVILTNLTRQ